MSEIKAQNINPEKIIKESLLRLSEILDSGLAITLNDQIISNYHPPYSFKYEKNKDGDIFATFCLPDESKFILHFGHARQKGRKNGQTNQ